ncbi:MAG TPA: hypothetical protein VGC71_08520 [Gaiellales bacterium]|jgi:hypothetical protein
MVVLAALVLASLAVIGAPAVALASALRSRTVIRVGATEPR